MFSTVPLNIVKTFIVPILDEKSFRALFSTCKRFYGMYSPMERLYLWHMKNTTHKEMVGKRKCLNCGLFVFTERYVLHIMKCGISYNVHDREYMSQNPPPQCQLCDSYDMCPQLFHTKKHPLIGCQECGIGISSLSIGCVGCKKFYCNFTSCKYCKEMYVSCTVHICHFHIKRWLTMLSTGCMIYNGIQYANPRIIGLHNRIAAEGIFMGKDCRVNWILSSKASAKRFKLPDTTIVTRRTIYIIVEEDATSIDESLISMNLINF